ACFARRVLLEVRVDREPAPRAGNVLDVVAVDPVQRRVLRVREAAALRPPLSVLGPGLRARTRRRAGRRDDARKEGERFSHESPHSLTIATASTSIRFCGEINACTPTIVLAGRLTCGNTLRFASSYAARSSCVLLAMYVFSFP